jgi:hypothetical protein
MLRKAYGDGYKLNSLTNFGWGWQSPSLSATPSKTANKIRPLLI